MKQTLKECTKCGIFKAYSDFYPKINYCKTCRNLQIKLQQKDYENHYYSNNKEKIQAQRKLARETNLETKFKHMYRNAKQRAIDKSFEFNIVWSDIMNLWVIQNGVCALSGRCMALTGERWSDKVSLDRIDSTKGYVKGNIQLVTSQVNYMKVDMNQDEFINICRDIVRKTHG